MGTCFAHYIALELEFHQAIFDRANFSFSIVPFLFFQLYDFRLCILDETFVAKFLIEYIEKSPVIFQFFFQFFFSFRQVYNLFR